MTTECRAAETLYSARMDTGSIFFTKCSKQTIFISQSREIACVADIKFYICSYFLDSIGLEDTENHGFCICVCYRKDSFQFTRN